MCMFVCRDRTRQNEVGSCQHFSNNIHIVIIQTLCLRLNAPALLYQRLSQQQLYFMTLKL